MIHIIYFTPDEYAAFAKATPMFFIYKFKNKVQKGDKICFQNTAEREQLNAEITALNAEDEPGLKTGYTAIGLSYS